MRERALPFKMANSDYPCIFTPANLAATMKVFTRTSESEALFHFAPQPNWSFNTDANTGHAFGILMACVGTLRASRYGAG